MNHPEDLLADYVDGSLGDAARASVDAHLAECARCRDEVGSAGAARAALRRLPQVESPAGVAAKALQEAARSNAEGPPRYARLLPIAAAAVLVGLLAIALPRLGDDATTPRAAGAASEAAGDAVSSPTGAGSTQELAGLARGGARVDKVQVDFDDESLRALVDETAARWGGVAFPNDVSFGAQGESLSAPNMAADMRVTRCVFDDVPEEQPSILVQLIEATYQGEPAYVAVVLEGTETGKPADRAVVWIVRKDGCSLARVAEAAI